MALDFTRTYELDLYTQLPVGDPGYIDPALVDFIVDHDGWTRAKRFPYTSVSGISSHYETDKLENLITRTITKTFNTPFTGSIKTIMFRVYRMAEVSTGTWRMKNVAYGSTTTNWLTVSGFNIVIDSSESLTGIVIEYYFI